MIKIIIFIWGLFSGFALVSLIYQFIIEPQNWGPEYLPATRFYITVIILFIALVTVRYIKKKLAK